MCINFIPAHCDLVLDHEEFDQTAVVWKFRVNIFLDLCIMPWNLRDSTENEIYQQVRTKLHRVGNSKERINGRVNVSISAKQGES